MFPIKFLSSAHSRTLVSEQGSDAETQGTEEEKEKRSQGSTNRAPVMLINQKTMMSPMMSWPMLFNGLKTNVGLIKALSEGL